MEWFKRSGPGHYLVSLSTFAAAGAIVWSTHYTRDVIRHDIDKMLQESNHFQEQINHQNTEIAGVRIEINKLRETMESARARSKHR